MIEWIKITDSKETQPPKDGTEFLAWDLDPCVPEPVRYYKKYDEFWDRIGYKINFTHWAKITPPEL